MEKQYLYSSYTLLYNMKTTIQVDKKTLENIKKIKLTKRESYDEIINRQIKNQNATNTPNKN